MQAFTKKSQFFIVYILTYN